MKKVLRAKELAIKQEPFGGIIPPPHLNEG